MQMHQVVLLTTHEVSTETLQKLFTVAHGRAGDVGEWGGFIFKLEETVDMPERTVSQTLIEEIYGKLAP